MRLRLRRLHQDESGQVVAFFVCILVLIFGFMALAIDLGFFFHARRVAQNAADPAALAGAAALSNCALADLYEPEPLATDYALRNLEGKAFTIGDDDLIIRVPPESDPFTYTDPDTGDSATFDTVYAQVQREQSFIFGRFLGLTSGTVPAEAEAGCVYGNELEGMCPFYLVAPSDEAPVFGPDPDGDGPLSPPLISGFGIKMNEVYWFDFSAVSPFGAERGVLDIFQPNNIATIVQNGCTGPLQSTGPCDLNAETIVEDEVEACTMSGNVASAPATGSDNYYAYETDSPADAWPSHSECNISFDESIFLNDPRASAPPLDPSDTSKTLTLTQIEARIDLCGDDPDPSDMISGRIWPIAILEELPQAQGNQKYTIKYLALMYQACVEYDNNQNDCGDDDGNTFMQSMFGLFVNARQVNFKVSGIGTGPFAPMHVVLLK